MLKKTFQSTLIVNQILLYNIISTFGYLTLLLTGIIYAKFELTLTFWHIIILYFLYITIFDLVPSLKIIFRKKFSEKLMLKYITFQIINLISSSIFIELIHTLLGRVQFTFLLGALILSPFRFVIMKLWVYS